MTTSSPFANAEPTTSATDRPTVNGHERSLAPSAQLVNLPGHMLLARARFTLVATLVEPCVLRWTSPPISSGPVGSGELAAQAFRGDEFADLPRIEDGARLFLRDGVSFGVIMGKTARAVEELTGCGGSGRPSELLRHRDRNSGERRRIGQMSSDAEDGLARIKLLVQALADTRARAEVFTTAMREESAQVAVAIAALTKPEHPSK